MSLPLWEECAWFRPEDLDPVTVTESGTVKDSLIVADSRAVRDSNTVNDLNTFPDAVSTIDSSTVIDSSALTNEVLEEITNTIASGSLLGSDKVVEGSEGTPKESKETPTTGTTEEVADSAAESANCQTSDRFDDPFGVVITTCTPKDSKLVHDLSARVSDIGIVEEAVDRPKIRPIVFPCRPDINKRIFLHCGDAYKIPCDCLAIGQNEQLNEKSDGNESIYLLAGPTIEEELLAVGRIQTGEAIITKSGNLPCDYVIHAVGPKFDKRYLTASDHALFSAYKTTLLLAAAQGVKSLVIKTLYHKVKKYPRFEAAHVALRAIRKFLNHSIGDVFERIMICVDDEDDYEIYKTLMIGYFPRNSTDLESQGIMLPSDEELGDEWGEIFIKDRAVTITAGPRPIAPKPSIAGNIENDDNSEGRLSNGSTTNGSTGRSRAASSDIKTGSNKLAAVGPKPRSMTEMDTTADEKRWRKVQKQLTNLSNEEKLKIRYQEMVEDAFSESLDDIEAMDFISITGKDRIGRDIVWITAANLNAVRVKTERILFYVIRVMERLRCVPYVMVYANSSVDSNTSPPSDFLQQIFDLFASRYKENLQQLFIIHSSYLFRMYFWFALPFLNTPFWRSYICCESLFDLNKFIEIKTVIDLPPVIKKYDDQVYRKSYDF